MSTVLWLILLVIPILPNLWCIWHAHSSEFASPVERLLWIGAGVFIPVIGGLLYLAIGRCRTVKPQSFQQPGGNLTN